MVFLDFSAVFTKWRGAEKEGIEPPQDEIDKVVKKLTAAQDFLNEHGLQEDEGAPRASSAARRSARGVSQQHRRVYGIMARSLDNVATELGQFATGIDTAARWVTTTDDDIGGELPPRALTLQANNSDLNDYDPHLGHGGKHHGVSLMAGNQEQPGCGT